MVVWAPDYLTLVQLKGALRIDPADVTDDAELAPVITAASRAIDDHCHRQFGNVAAQARVYVAEYDYARGVWVIPIDDLQTIAGLVVMVDGVAVTGYVLEPRNAVLEGKAWTALRLTDVTSIDDREVTITAPWGWTAFPVPVIQAAKLQATRFSARRDSPYGIAGSPDQGSEMRLLARVDPDVAVSLRGLVRPRRVG